MKSVLTLSRRKSLSYRNQSINMQSRSMDWLLYDKDFLHEKVNALLLASIHQDIFFDYEKTSDISASKYAKKMLSINPPSEN